MNYKEYYSIENQLHRIEENKKLQMDEKRYRKLLKTSDFEVHPKWHLKKSEINLKHLGDDCHKDLDTANDYSLYLINRTDLFDILDESYKTVFTKDKIWKNHDKDKIIKVIRNWENGEYLIPPILILNGTGKKLLIQDGKHRFAVANYFNADEIPIIILNEIENRFLELSGEKVKKIN